MARTMVWAARSHLCSSMANLNSLIGLPLFPEIIAHMFYYDYKRLSYFAYRDGDRESEIIS